MILNKEFEFIHSIIKKQWVIEIITSLNEKPKKYTNLLSQLEYISKTELNRKLKLLLQNNVINKDDGDHYVLEPLGKDLVSLSQLIHKIGRSYLN